MKTIVTTVFLFLSLSFICASTPISEAGKVVTEDNSLFGRFNAHRQHNSIALNWTVTSLENIENYVIQRSYDGIYFEDIGSAMATSSASYRYKDNSVFPGFIYYRVVAIMNDGEAITSSIEMVRIVSRK